MTGATGTDRRSSDYLPHIDGLRALAVLSVIVYHLHAPWLPGGFTGVDVFFVISGFVVSASIDKAQHPGLSGLMAFFYARRIQRILPALLVCLLVTSLMVALFVPKAWLSATNARTAAFAFFGLSNLVLARSNDDYFSPKTEFNPFTHTWSLGVEEQFYFLFPLLFAGWVLRERWPRGARWSVALFAGLGLASLLAGAWLAKTDPTDAFYMITGRFWELAVGALLYQWVRARNLHPGPAALQAVPGVLLRLAVPGALLSLAVVLAGFVVIQPKAPTVPWMLAPVLGTAGLLLCVGAQPDGAVGRWLGTPALAYVGRISYSLYLWHWPVFVLFRWTVGIESVSARLLALLLCAALAVLSYHFVEVPVRYAASLRRFSRARVAWGGLAAALLACLLNSQLLRMQPQLTLSVTRDTDIWYPTRYRPDAGAACRLDTRKESVAGGEIQIFSRSGCDAPTSAGRLFVMGDSHALAYAPMLQQLTFDLGVEVWLYSKGGCSILNLVHLHNSLGPQCQVFFEGALTDVGRRMTARDVLFLSSLRVTRFGDQYGALPPEFVRNGMTSPGAKASRAESVAEAIQVLRPLAERGVAIVFEAPKPHFRAPAFRCSDWFNRDNPSCVGGLELPRDFLLEFRRPVMESFDVLAQGLRTSRVWDPFALLCPGPVCAAVPGGKPLFFDGDHISGHGNRLLYPDFKSFVTPLLGVGGAM